MKLEELITKLPPSRLKEFVKAEIPHREETLDEVDRFLPQLKLQLRVLMLNEQIAKEELSLRGQTEAEQNATHFRIGKYSELAIRFQRGAEPESPMHEEAKPSLSILIERQKALIFNRCLLLVALRHLKRSDQHEGTFCSSNIMRETLGEYKRIIYPLTLCHLEAKCLVERLDYLTADKEWKSKDMGIYGRLVLYSIIPEIDFINGVLIKLNAAGLALRGMREMSYELGEVAELSSRNLKECFTAALEARGDENIAPELLAVQVGDYRSDIKCRSTKLYVGEHLIPDMLQLALEIEKLESTLVSAAASHPASDPVVTEDADLIKFRAAVEKYKRDLDQIEAHEQTIFVRRNLAAVQQRRVAVEALEICVNQASKLTPGLRVIVQALHGSIRRDKPQWSELPPRAKCLDFGTLGAHVALRRHSLFKHTPDSELELDALVTTDKGIR